MTLEDICQLVVSVDPNARHYRSMSNDDAYTYWEETQQLPFTSDDRHDEAWRFYVHRYTKTENDLTAAALLAALDSDPRVTVIYTPDHDPDDETIHHIYQCEGY